MDSSDALLSARPSRLDTASPFSAGLRRAVADLVLETTNEGIWLIDDAERTTFVNHHMAQLLGYSVDEMLGQHIFTFMDDEGRVACQRYLERRRNGIQETLEFRLVRKDGQQVWVLVATNPVYDRTGRYAGALGLIADLGLQKDRERGLSSELAELRARVVAQEQELAEVRMRSAAWEKASATDWLTGLYNRRHFEHHLSTEISRYERRVGRFCLLLIDLDGFANVNERFGRDVSDNVLRAVARELDRCSEASTTSLRSTDIAARYDGDSFAILAVDTNLEGGAKLAERLLARIAALQVVTPSGQLVPVAASAGVAAFPTQARTPKPLLDAAEQALFMAKHTGGGRFCVGEAPRRD